MSLAKQTLFIPLGQGLRTDVDAKLLPLGPATQQENVLWTALAGDGTLVKRPGYTAMGTQYVGSSSAMPPPWQFAQHKGATLALSKAGVRPVGIYSPAIGKWSTSPALQTDVNNGPQSRLRGPLLATRSSVFRSASASGLTSNATNVDVATDGTFALVAWTNTSGSQTIQARVLELATGKMLFADTAVTGGVGSIGIPKAAYANGFFSLVWTVTSGSITEIHWSSANLAAGNGAPSGNQVLATGLVSNIFDMQAQGTNVQIITGTAGNATRIVYPGGSPVSHVNTNILNHGGGAISAQNAWVTDLGGSGKQAIISADGSGLTLHYDIASGTAASSTVLDATITSAFTMTAHTLNSTGDVMAIAQIVSPNQALRLAWKVGASVSAKTWLNSISLKTKTFLHNADFYVGVCNESVTQGANFIIRVPGVFQGSALDTADYTQAPSARYCTNVAPNGDGTLAGVTSTGVSTLISATLVRTREYTTAVGVQFDIGVDLVNLTFDPTAVGAAREYADSTYTCGGILAAFDGLTYAEEGFHAYPENPVVTGQNAGSMTASGVYYYAGCYRYTDNQGRIHRSDLSPIAQVTLSGSQHGANIVVKTLKLTGRPGACAIELYRVRNAGDTPNLLYLNQVVANDETVDTVTINDQASDASMGTAMPAYTTDDPNQVAALPSGPPPTPLALALFQGRLAVVVADDPTLIRPNLPLTDFDGKGWPIWALDGTGGIRIEDQHGNLTGLAAMDDKLLAFKNDAVYVLTGAGPDVTGNGIWNTPAFVCTGIGCGQPRSILETPDGVIFRTTSGRAGYYMINRGLSLQYIGSPVEGYLNDPIVDAVYLAGQSRAMFFTSTGRTHVLDMSNHGEVPTWTTFVGQAATCAGIFNGLPVYQRSGFSTLAPLTEDATGTVWSENGAQNDEYVLTPWLSLNMLKGYERFFKLQGVGQFVGRHVVTVTMYLNFDDSTIVDTRTILVGATGPTSDWNAWEFKHSTKASAFRFGIRCSKYSGDGSDTAGANITGISIEWGGKQGMRKVPSGNRLT